MLHSVMPLVEPSSFLTLHYRLTGPNGEVVVNTFEQQPATLSMGQGQLSPALEARLLGMPEGDHATHELAAGEAFGPRNPELLQWVAGSLLRELSAPDTRYAPGDVVQFPGSNGGASYAGVVQEVRDDGALLMDFNHPLAGQPVRFEVQLIGVLN